MSMNLVVLEGRIAREPEMKTTNSGIEFCTFCVVTDSYAGKDKEKASEFHDVIAWRQTAAFISKYFHKGDGILLNGSIHYNTFEDKETGKKRKMTNIVVEQVAFPSGKKSGNSEQPSEAQTFEELPDEGALPF